MTFLHTQEFGTPDGEAVVLLSSIATTSDAWSEVIPALSGYRVITVDHRGHGGSGVPAERPTEVGTLGHDVLAALDELGVDRFCVVGVSPRRRDRAVARREQRPRRQGRLRRHRHLPRRRGGMGAKDQHRASRRHLRPDLHPDGQLVHSTVP